MSIARIVSGAKISPAITSDFLARMTISNTNSGCMQVIRWFTAATMLCFGGSALAASVTHNYTVTVDYSLSRLSIEARFEHPVDSITATLVRS